MTPSRLDTISDLFARRRAARAAAPATLFVQSFHSGTITPNKHVDGHYTITLDPGLGETISFSDRPDRTVGSTPTAAFLEGRGFSEANPPNAAILTSNAEGDTTLAIVELFAPVYDAATASVTYDVEILDHWKDEAELGFSETPVNLDALGTTDDRDSICRDRCCEGWRTCWADTFH